MDHAFEYPLAERDPRRLTFLLGLVAAVEAIVIVVGGAVLLAKPVAHEIKNVALSQPAPVKLSKGQVGPTTPAGKATLSRAQTTVLVLNGNGVNGAAGAAASSVRHAGYPVRAVGNAPRTDYPSSLVMFRPGFRAEALRFGRDLGVKTVGPLDGLRVGAVHGAKLVYILGS